MMGQLLYHHYLKNYPFNKTSIYSVHLETQFFLPPVSPVEGTETGLTGGGKRQNTKWRSKVNAMQKNRKGFAPFPENS